MIMPNGGQPNEYSLVEAVGCDTPARRATSPA
jgi:hypothetical protein